MPDSKSHSTLTKKQRERGIEYARTAVAEGHHGQCETRHGGKCDCYFKRPDYLSWRLAVELYEQLEALRNFNAATRAAWATLSGVSSDPPEDSGVGPGPLDPASTPASTSEEREGGEDA